jgi:hypothetical protein
LKAGFGLAPGDETEAFASKYKYRPAPRATAEIRKEAP